MVEERSLGGVYFSVVELDPFMLTSTIVVHPNVLAAKHDKT